MCDTLTDLRGNISKTKSKSLYKLKWVLKFNLSTKSDSTSEITLYLFFEKWHVHKELNVLPFAFFK